MSVRRGGSVIVGGSSGGALGQTSSSPNVRHDVTGFNVPLDRDKFTQLITVHGYKVLWERASYCPYFRGPSPRDHDINCDRCLNGFMYYEPTLTTMHVQSLSISQQYYAYGHFASGKAQITAYPEYKVSFFDRITLCESRLRTSELVTRQRDTTTDLLKSAPVGVERVTWVDSDNALQVATSVDYSPSENGITWQTAHRPNADTTYTIVYYARPVYIVLDAPHHVRDEAVIDSSGERQSFEFPVQVTGQLERFARDEGLDPNNENFVTNPFKSKR